MPNLTQKELTSLEEALGTEQLLVKKFRAYAQQAKDPEISDSAEQMAERHKQHYDTLMGYLY